MVTTIFNDPFTAGTSGDENISIRQNVGITANAQGQIRATFQSNPGLVWSTAHCSIGIFAATGSNDTTATPVELTFSGGHGFTTTAGGSVVSDWVNLTGFTTSDRLVVIMDNAATNGNEGIDTTWTDAGASAYYWTGTPQWNVKNASATGASVTGTNTVLGVTKIEVQSASQAGSANLAGAGSLVCAATINNGLAVTSEYSLQGTLGTTAATFTAPINNHFITFTQAFRQAGAFAWSGTANLAGAGTLAVDASVKSVFAYPQQFAGAGNMVAKASVISAAKATFAGVGTLGANATIPGAATPTLVWHVSSASNIYNMDAATGDHWKIRPANPTLAGNCLILKISYDRSLSAPTITDDNGNTWPAATVTVDGGSGLLKSAVYVLPNANVGAATITVYFGTLTSPFFYEYSEWRNVDTTSPVNGTITRANMAGTALSFSSSLTPTTNNDSNGGNLILAFYDAASANPATVGENSVSNWAPGTNFTLLSADRAGLDNQGYPHACQYWVQTTSGAINPAITATGGTGNFNLVAIALKAAAAGTAPATGIHVDRILHCSQANPPGSNWYAQLPAGGNLWVAQVNIGDAVTSFTDNSDSYATSWTKLSGGGGYGAIFYRDGVSAHNDLVVRINGLPTPGWSVSVRFYDISGAASSSALSNSALASGDCSSATTLNNAPSITPLASGVNGLCIAGLSLGLGPATGFISGAPSGAIFDLINYDTQTDQCTMDNSDGSSHYYVPSTTTINWNYAITSQTSNSYDAVAAIFKASSVTAWSDSATLAGAGGLSVSGLVYKYGGATFAGAGNFASTVHADLYVGGFAGFAGAGNFASTVHADLYAGGFAGFSGTGSLGVTAYSLEPGVATFAGSGGLSCSAAIISVNNSATFAGVGGLGVTAYSLEPGVATFAGSGGLSVSSTLLEAINTTFAGIGNLGVTAYSLNPGTATFAGVGNLVADATKTGQQYSGAILTGAGGLSVAPVLLESDKATFNAAGSLSVSAYSLNPGVAIFAGAGSLNVSSTLLEADNATFAGSGGLSVSAYSLNPGTATFAGVGGLSVSSTLLEADNATFAGSGNLGVVAYVLRSATATLTGVGTLVADAQKLGQQSTGAILSGTGGLNVNGTLIEATSTSFAGAGSLGVVAYSLNPGTATLTGTGGLSTSATSLVPGVSILSGTGGLSVAATLIAGSSTTLAGIGSLGVTTYSLESGSAAFAGVGTLVADAQKLGQQSTGAILTGAGNLSAIASVRSQGSSTLAGSGTLTVLEVQREAAFATFAGAGSLGALATGATTWYGSATLAGIGSLTNTPIVIEVAKAILAGVGNQTVTSYVLSAANLTGSSNIVAQATIQAADSATFAGNGILGASTTERIAGLSTFSGSGTLSVSAGVISPVGTVSLAGAGNLSVAPTQNEVAKATLAGSGGLAAQAVVPVGANLIASGGMFAGAQVIVAANSNLAGNGTVQVATKIALAGNATLAGSGNVNANVSGKLAGYVNFLGDSNVGVTCVLGAQAAAYLYGSSTINVTTSIRQDAVYHTIRSYDVEVTAGGVYIDVRTPSVEVSSGTNRMSVIVGDTSIKVNQA